MEELSHIVIKLRSENEQMINTFLDKVNRLSDQITQVHYPLLLRQLFITQIYLDTKKCYRAKC